MNGDQKFKRGNLVKMLYGHHIWTKNGTIDLSPENVGRLAIIEYSYAEMYGGDDKNSYSIIWQDTGDTESWKSPNQMELIDEGGDHLIQEAQAKYQINTN